MRSLRRCSSRERAPAVRTAVRRRQFVFACLQSTLIAQLPLSTLLCTARPEPGDQPYIRLDKYRMRPYIYYIRVSKFIKIEGNMSDIQQAVKDKYGAIATAVTEKTDPRRQAAAAGRRPAAAATRSPPISTPTPRPAACRPTPSPRRSAAATRPRCSRSSPARRCSTSAPAAASTCCCRRSASGRPARSYGLDMTDEMLALARENQRKAGATNVEFLKGTSRRSRCRTTRSTSSSRTASSTSRPTRTPCCARRSAC